MRIGSISGSLQRLVNDVSYLVAGSNVTIVSGSNGQVTISSTGGGGGGGYEQAFNSGDLVAGILSVTHGLPDDYVHVSVYDDTDHQIIPNEVIITGIGTLDIDLSSFSVPASPDWHVFITSANASLGGGTPASPDRSIQFNNAGSFGGSANLTYDGKLSLTGSFLQSNASGDTVGFMGDEPSMAPSTVGPDVFFYVSGSKGGKDSSTPGVTLFGGDVVISGTLHGGSPLKIGTNTQITGTLSQGTNAHAIGSDSHAEGSSVYAIGLFSHAQNVGTIAEGYASHAEGGGTLAFSSYSHAEGRNTEALGDASHAQNYESIAAGNYSHAEGYFTRTSATAQGAHAGGYLSEAVGSYARAVGYWVIASGSNNGQAVVGKYNLRDNAESLFIVGNGTGDSDPSRSDIIRVEMNSVQVSGSLWQTNDASSTIGFMGDDSGSPVSVGTDVFFFVSGSSGSMGTTSRGVAAFGGDVMITGSLKVGTGSITITSDYIQFGNADHKITKNGNDLMFYDINVPLGATLSSLTGSTPASPVNSIQYNNAGVFGGSSNFTYDGAQVFLGGKLRVGNSAVADGTNSIASGEGQALSAYSVAYGKTTYASGENSFVHGQGSQAHASNSHAEGVQTSAGEAGSHAEGYRTVSSGTYSHAEGIETIASGSGQHAEGKYNIRGNSHSLLVIGNGTDEFDSTRSDIVRVEMNSVQISGSLWQTNSGSSTVGFMGGDAGVPQQFGTDVFFYVSGSKSSKDGPMPTVALFGGDVVISGTLHGGSPLKVGSDLVITGSIATTQHYHGEVQLLTASGTDVSNVTHMTLMTSTTGEYTSNLPDGLHVGQIKYILAGDITNAMVSPTITVTATTPRPVQGLQWTSLTFQPGDAITLVWTAEGWATLSFFGASINYPS